MPFDHELFKRQQSLKTQIKELDAAQKKINQFPDGKATPDDEGAIQSAKALRDKLTEKISMLEN